MKTREQFTGREYEWMLAELRTTPAGRDEDLEALRQRLCRALEKHTGFLKPNGPSDGIVRELLSALGQQLAAPQPPIDLDEQRHLIGLSDGF